jgi:K+-sensing histidine kinase KdpD
MVTAVTGLFVLLRPWLLPLRVVYVLAVVPVAIVWGTRLAVLAAVLSGVAYEYLFAAVVASLGHVLGTGRTPEVLSLAA